jgi:hypothetical protein
MRRTIVIALGLAVTLAACGGGSSSNTPNGGQTTSGTRLSSSGELAIVDPAPGTVVRGTETVVKITLQGGKVIEQTSTDLKPDEGHIHVTLDGKLLTLLAGLEYKVTGLTPGSHIVQVEFVAADHGPFNPRVLATSTFTAA